MLTFEKDGVRYHPVVYDDNRSPVFYSIPMDVEPGADVHLKKITIYELSERLDLSVQRIQEIVNNSQGVVR